MYMPRYPNEFQSKEYIQFLCIKTRKVTAILRDIIVMIWAAVILIMILMNFETENRETTDNINVMDHEKCNTWTMIMQVHSDHPMSNGR